MRTSKLHKLGTSTDKNKCLDNIGYLVAAQSRKIATNYYIDSRRAHTNARCDITVIQVVVESRALSKAHTSRLLATQHCPRTYWVGGHLWGPLQQAPSQPEQLRLHAKQSHVFTCPQRADGKGKGGRPQLRSTKAPVRGLKRAAPRRLARTLRTGHSCAKPRSVAALALAIAGRATHDVGCLAQRGARRSERRGGEIS